MRYIAVYSPRAPFYRGDWDRPDWQVPSVAPGATGETVLVVFPPFHSDHPRRRFETEETKSSKSRNNETWYRSVELGTTSLLRGVFTPTMPRCIANVASRYCAQRRDAYLMAYNYHSWKTHSPDGSFFPALWNQRFSTLARAVPRCN